MEILFEGITVEPLPDGFLWCFAPGDYVVGQKRGVRPVKWSKKELYDVLENHEIETDALCRQLETLAKMLNSDLEEIRHRAYPGAVSYDKERIQASLAPYDDRLASVVMACDVRREQHKKDVAIILNRLNDIRAVYTTIHQLDAISKTTLLNLYYPRHTLETVADKMGIDRGTVRSRKKAAICALLEMLKKSLQF